jgi:hypothetical protein
MPDKVGLSGAGGTVEQHTAFEVLSGRTQRFAMLADTDHVPGDAFAYALRQDDLVSANLGPPKEC